MTKLNLRIQVKRVSDGALSDQTWKDWDYNTYWWEEGNAACDCNRLMFFHRGRGEPEPEDTPCGSNAFLVKLTDADTGQVLYDEFDPAADGHGLKLE